jgi:hypothetical protein
MTDGAMTRRIDPGKFPFPILPYVEQEEIRVFLHHPDKFLRLDLHDCGIGLR